MPVEAMAAGRRVIAYGRGGVLDSVIDGKTGILFDAQTRESLSAAVQRLEGEFREFKSASIAEHAARFDREQFKSRLSAFINDQASRRKSAEARRQWRATASMRRDISRRDCSIMGQRFSMS